MSVGDLIEGYTDDIDQLDKEWEEFEGFIDQFEMPFFYVAGNHDYSNKTQAKQWREKFGAEYYHFLYKTLIPVRQLPVFLKNGTIDAVEFYAFNPDNEERTVRLELSKGAYIAPLEAEIEIVLKPNEVRMIKALVSVTGKIDKHQRSLHTTTEFIGEDFVWSRNYNAVPFERVSIPFARKNISVDGNLSDWTREKKCLTGNFGKRDKNDANVDFSIFQSEDMLYISAAVKDNDVQSGFSDNPFAHDAVVLSLDARPLSQSAYNRREHESFMRGEWLPLIIRPNATEFSLAFNELLPQDRTR